MTLPERLEDVPQPDASTRQGVPGHDQALDRANAIRLLTLKVQGLSYEQMAKEVGYADASGARQALMRALNRHEAESVGELRAIEGMRLDADERALRAIIGDRQADVHARIGAVNARTRLAARRAALFGLDAPTKIDMSTGVRADLDAALAELRDAVLGDFDVVEGEVIDDADQDAGAAGTDRGETPPG